MKEITKCPWCESEKLHLYEKHEPYDYYECEECGRIFDKEDAEREELRHQISPLLDGTSEEEPAEIFFNLPSAEEEAQGLSSLEIPSISKIYEMEGEGTMWFHIFGEKEESGEDRWHDLDELSIGDLEALLKYLREEL